MSASLAHGLLLIDIEDGLIGGVLSFGSSKIPPRVASH